MTMGADARRVVGAEVYTKATHITNHAECSRLFETMASTKWIRGTVKEVAMVVKNGRRMTRLVVAWEPAAKMVEKELSLGCVSIRPLPRATCRCTRRRRLTLL